MIETMVLGKQIKVGAHCVVCKKIRVITDKGYKWTEQALDDLPEEVRSLVGGTICDKCHSGKVKK